MEKRLRILLAALAFVMAATVNAQITTSSMAGKVIDTNKEAIIGATVKAVHTPSGTSYGAVTNIDGRYTIQGMRVGGPYTVTITYIGYATTTESAITLRLGETYNLNATMTENSQELGEVVVTSKRGLDASKTGAAQSISSRQIEDMPTVSHSIADIARLNPQIVTNGQSGAMAFAGTNNRYNSFMVDGAMNNDVFGLTSSGQNGGQANSTPVSMETIDQVQVSIAPFDVRQGGFTGGAINAITKSGTNQFHGSRYFYGSNQDLIGSKYKLSDGSYSSKYDDESEITYGWTFGGPIIKDKLFFFGNYERTKKSVPVQYGLGSDGSKVDAEQAQTIIDCLNTLAELQGTTYPGYYTSADNTTESEKFSLKLDWNINDFNKLAVRWSYVDASQLKGNGSMSSLVTNLYQYNFNSQTHTLTAELQTRISPKMSNEARASYVRVRDERVPGSAYPYISVSSVGNGTVYLGNEYSSMANGLDQDIWTIEDNLTWYLGNHTLTAGTHNEIYQFSNLYIQYLYGYYTFSSYDNFMSYYNSALQNGGYGDGSYLSAFSYQQANEDITGNPRWEASFGAAQLGFYLQDKWDILNNLQLTYGLRMDMPIFFDKPAENAGFNEYAATMGWGVKTNQKLASTPMWSPRVGFRWDINNDRKFILRGGVGIFTGRIPFVWLSNNFSNTGVQLSSYYTSSSSALADLTMILDPNSQTTNAEKMSATSGSQTVNVFDKNFKFSQNLRFNLGFDANFLGIDWTIEGIYSKTLNDVYYKNLRYEAMTNEDGSYVTFADTYGYEWENKRVMMQKTSGGSDFTNIYMLCNTSKGYTYNLSIKGEKHFNFGLDLMASYTYTKSKSVCSATSSVAQSNWRGVHTYGDPNAAELANSGYNVPHTIKASAFYHLDYGKNKEWSTVIGLVYQGQSGSPYSLYYSGNMNGDGYAYNDLIFIPTDAQIDQMSFKATTAYSEDEQRANLKAFLASSPYLKDHRGEYYERNAHNLPFESHFDLHLAEKYSFKNGCGLEVSLDIMNVANLLNKNWGLTYASSYMSTYSYFMNYSGNGVYQFLHDADYKLFGDVFTASDYYSRWRGQLGVKFTF